MSSADIDPSQLAASVVANIVSSSTPEPAQTSPVNHFETWHDDPNTDEDVMSLSIGSLCGKLATSVRVAAWVIADIEWYKESGSPKHEYLVIAYGSPVSVPAVKEKLCYLRLDRAAIVSAKGASIRGRLKFTSNSSSSIFPAKDTVSICDPAPL